MKCKECIEQLSAYYDKVLSENEKVEVENHLKTCKTCEQEWHALKNILNELGAVQQVDMPENLHQSIMSRIQEEKVLPLKARRLRPWMKTVAGMAATFVFTIGLIEYGQFLKKDQILGESAAPMVQRAMLMEETPLEDKISDEKMADSPKQSKMDSEESSDLRVETAKKPDTVSSEQTQTTVKEESQSQEKVEHEVKKTSKVEEQTKNEAKVLQAELANTPPVATPLEEPKMMIKGIRAEILYEEWEVTSPQKEQVVQAIKDYALEQGLMLQENSKSNGVIQIIVEGVQDKEALLNNLKQVDESLSCIQNIAESSRLKITLK